jgi:hypothetical protein
MIAEIVHWSGLPVACTALGAGGFVAWVMPGEARRTLRAAVAVIELDLVADERLRLLPGNARRVRLVAVLMRSIARAPERWKMSLTEQLPSLDGSFATLTAVQQGRLDRYVERLEATARRYARRSRLVGRPVPADVADVLAELQLPSGVIDVTGPADFRSRSPSVLAATIDSPQTSSPPEAPSEPEV